MRELMLILGDSLLNDTRVFRKRLHCRCNFLRPKLLWLRSGDGNFFELLFDFPKAFHALLVLLPKLVNIGKLGTPLKKVARNKHCKIHNGHNRCDKKCSSQSFSTETLELKPKQSRLVAQLILIHKDQQARKYDTRPSSSYILGRNVMTGLEHFKAECYRASSRGSPASCRAAPRTRGPRASSSTAA